MSRAADAPAAGDPADSTPDDRTTAAEAQPRPVPAQRPAPDQPLPAREDSPAGSASPAVPAPAVPDSPAIPAIPAIPASPAVPASSAVPAPAVSQEGDLTDREREILAFEELWWKHAGAKEQAIRDAFDLSTTRYYQILNGLLDNPAALVAAPMLVARLRRLRSARARTRRR